MVVGGVVSDSPVASTSLDVIASNVDVVALLTFEYIA